MAALGWTILLVALVWSGDVGWCAYRDWRIRRHAARASRTLTARYTLMRY